MTGPEFEELLRNQGYSPHEAGELLEVSYRTIYRLMRGEKKITDMHELAIRKFLVKKPKKKEAQ